MKETLKDLAIEGINNIISYLDSLKNEDLKNDIVCESIEKLAKSINGEDISKETLEDLKDGKKN